MLNSFIKYSEITSMNTCMITLLYVYIIGNRLSPPSCARYELEVLELELILPDVSYISTATSISRLG